jgi:hypothetical protein
LNPQPSDLESDALAVRATGLCLCLLMKRMSIAVLAIFLKLEFVRCILLVLCSGIIFILTFCTLQQDNLSHSSISVTTPAPTVLPPSLMANLNSFSRAMGAISSTVMFTLSPGITISTPSGSFTTPVTSVVLK